MDEYFCPNCGATLNDQYGFDPSCGSWTCASCGKYLMDDDVYDGDSYKGVAWYCDDCGALLNRQSGFSDSNGSWTCTECGYENGTTKDDIYESEEEYECHKKNKEWSDMISSVITDALFGSSGSDLGNDESEEDDGNCDEKITCPNCGEVLNDQLYFDKYDDNCTCAECGTPLHHNYSDDEYSAVDVDEDMSHSYSTNSGHSYPPVHSNTGKKKKIVTPSVPKKKSFFQRHRKGAILSLFLLLVAGAVAFGIWEYQKLIPIGYDSDDLIGQNYENVIANLEKSGFTNVYAESTEDLNISEANQENQVYEIDISKRIEFDSDKKYPYDIMIVVKYHTLKLIAPPLSNKDAKGMNYADVLAKFVEIGFINARTEVKNDVIFGWIIKDGEVDSVTIDGEKKYSTTIEIRPDADVVITYHKHKSDKS